MLGVDKYSALDIQLTAGKVLFAAQSIEHSVCRVQCCRRRILSPPVNGDDPFPARLGPRAERDEQVRAGQRGTGFQIELVFSIGMLLVEDSMAVRSWGQLDRDRVHAVAVDQRKVVRVVLEYGKAA